LGKELDSDLVLAVSEFDRVDPRGEAFRYTRSHDGSPSLETEIRVDLHRLRENILVMRRKFIDLEVGMSVLLLELSSGCIVS